ncbi:1-acyl-sn-glycerol-3-phosphate acyltransferase [Salinibius halmophilus]|uniref:1-acyl-sn-glycerol-3-phosphate acyltransferase n=1 Tax=Salinibius halmophilus TaxID=1853216 RepID=UPI000E6759C0|nr:1-acyl-sn-glycerol-3-phosphate acyltransferase [Salinibius halmophilus]
MRLYRFIRLLLRAITRLYFLHIDAKFADRVPTTGPVILAANHPSSILDSVLLSTQLDRPVNYLAKSELFRSRILSRVYQQLGAIAIERGRGEAAIAQAFAKVIERLEAGKCVGIFPEGRNSPSLQIANLRSGTARLALEAEAKNDFSLGLVIVPVGINFESRELFMSSALLRFGRSVRVAAFKDEYKKAPDQAIAALTGTIEKELRRQANHIEDLRLSHLINDLGSLYYEAIEAKASKLPGPPATRWQRLLRKFTTWFRPTPVSVDELSDVFEGKARLNQTLSRASIAEPMAVELLRNRVERYTAHLRQVNLKVDFQQSFKQPVRERLLLLKMTVYTLAMAPFAAYGALHNFLPWFTTRFLARRFKDEAIRTFAYFGFGVITFIISYVLFGLWLWQFTDRNLTNSFIYVATFLPTGLIALHYRGKITNYRDKILVRTFFKRHDTLVRQLASERQAIVNRLARLHERYGDADTI